VPEEALRGTVSPIRRLLVHLDFLVVVAAAVSSAAAAAANVAAFAALPVLLVVFPLADVPRGLVVASLFTCPPRAVAAVGAAAPASASVRPPRPLS